MLRPSLLCALGDWCVWTSSESPYSFWLWLSWANEKHRSEIWGKKGEWGESLHFPSYLPTLHGHHGLSSAFVVMPRLSSETFLCMALSFWVPVATSSPQSTNPKGDGLICGTSLFLVILAHTALRNVPSTSGTSFSQMPLLPPDKEPLTCSPHYFFSHSKLIPAYPLVYNASNGIYLN